MTTATSGIFGHQFPDFVASEQGIVACRIADGKVYYPQFKAMWDKCGGVTRRCIYQFVDKTKGTIAENVSFLVEHLGNYAAGLAAVKEMPLIFYCNGNMNLTEIVLYLEYVYNTVLPKTNPIKPLMYIRPQTWENIYKGDNANATAFKIASMADIMLTEWNVNLPTLLPRGLEFFKKPKAWEYASGKFQMILKDTDVFTPNTVVPPVVVPPVVVPPVVVPPVVVPPVSGTTEQYVRLECLQVAAEVGAETFDKIIENAGKATTFVLGTTTQG